LFRKKKSLSLKKRQIIYLKKCKRKLLLNNNRRKSKIYRLKFYFKKRFVDFICGSTFGGRTYDEVNSLKARFLTQVQIKILFIFELVSIGSFISKNLFVKFFW